MNKTTKIFAFRLSGRNWAFQAVSPPIPSEANKISSFGELFNVLKQKKDTSKRTELLTDYVAHQMYTTWNKLGTFKEGSIRKRIFNLGQKLLSRSKPSEDFLKNIPNQTNSVEFIFPDGSNPQLVRRKVRQIAKNGVDFHKKWFYSSALLLPLTSILGILPIPNFPFFWNIYRTHAHWTALRGSRKLLELVTVPPKDPILSKSEILKFKPSQFLKDVVSRGTEEKSLDSTLETISNKYELDLGLLKKWVRTK